MAPIPHIRLFRIYLIALAGSFFLAASGPVAAQPRKDIFKKECVKIHKLYDALLARDTVRYKKLLAGNYDGVCQIELFDMDTLELLGTLEEKITITIQK